MKKRMKMLMAIFLSASMAVTPVTVMADDGQAQTQNTYEASAQETEVNTSLFGAETNEPETGTYVQKEEASDNQTPSVGTEEEAPASGGSSDSDERQGTSGSGEPEEISTGVQSQNTENTDSNSEGIEHVKELIAALPDIQAVTLDNEAQIKEAESAYNALSDADKATLDDPKNTPAGKEQSYGRVLESALWGLEVLKKVDNSTTLPQGKYSASTTPALTSSSSKGKSSSSRIRTWTVTEVTVDGQGKAVATIQVDSGTYTTLRTNGETYQGTASDKVTTFQNVPIDLNSTFYIAAYSSTMGTEIGYSVTTEIDESAATALTITNNTGMFKAETARLEKQGVQTFLVMDLSGSGYHELYKGTYEEAVSNGDGSKDKGNDSWVHGYMNSDGRWEFSIPLTGEELNGTDIPLVAVSNSYYSKYLNGKNDLKRAFYPRKIQVNESAKTLVTGDFTGETSLTVTLADGIMMKKPDAKLETVGGPNSNGYSETLKLIMQNGSYDRLYIGSKEDAAKAEANGGTTHLDDANTFTVAVREGSFGGNITNDYLEKPVIVSFRGTSSGKWVEKKVTISKTAKTLKIDPVTEQIKFRAVDEEGNTVEGASFTVKRKDTQINPDSDSAYTLVKDTAYTVEAGADGYETLTFTYTPDGTETEHTVTLKKDESAATALTITNNTGMFKAETARLEKQGDQTFLVMDLSGSGYHELYKGTYEEAVSNGDGSKDKGNDSWVHGYMNSDGRWEFSIPLTGEELNGTDIPLVAVSNTYYSKYQKGENELKRAFYPRKIQVDENAKTLVTGDFTGETSLTVTLADGIMMKKPDAKLETVGGPNSNGYSETLKLIMQNDSYDRLYIGSKEDAAEAETKGETTRLDDANTFTVVVREGSFGGNITKDYLEQPVIVSFRGTSSGNWVERKVTISKTAKTLKIDPVTEQIKFRAVDEEGNTVEGASFTVKRKDTQINPDSDSAYTLVKDTAYTVEAGADGYETLTFTYTPDGTETEHTVTLKKDESAATALTITNKTGMFKAVNARLEKQGDQTYLVMDLSGSGYHELYKGTYEEAVSNGDGSKDKGNDSWVHGYQNSEGRWEFSIPLTGEELNGTDIPLVAVSNTYYSKYQKGENELKRAFYPRKIQVDENAKTLVTGDFTSEASLAVTLADGIMMKKPDAKLETVGGPNSNGYSETLKLIMQNGSYDRLYIGSKEDAAKAEAKGETTRLDDANTFTVAVREGSFGGNIATDYLEQPVVVSFRGTSSGKWVERKVTISKTAKTLRIDPVTEQIKFRAVDEEGNTVEGASFTVKRKNTQINPDSDSTYTLVKDTAYTVEAGADGFEAQTFNYTPDGTETEHTVTLKKEKKEELKTVGLSYSAHVQNIGWQANVTEGTEAGTVGKSLQMEAIKLSTTGDADVQVEYRSHIQNSGWENGWTKEGQISGTTGKKLRMEAVQIRLTGSDADKYDIWYQAHVQNYGWLGWAKNGASAGTTGKGLRMEAIRVRILPKGSAAPGSTDGSYVEPLVCYQTHVQNKGWMTSASDGEIAGTTGKKLRMEAVKLTLNLPQSEGGIAYQSHLQNTGWEQSWKANGQISGTTGQKRRLEAVRIKLTGNIAEKYDIYYRVHVQNKGWTGWAKNGEDCGSTGLSLRGEALETVMVLKGAPAPGNTANTCWR